MNELSALGTLDKAILSIIYAADLAEFNAEKMLNERLHIDQAMMKERITLLMSSGYITQDMHITDEGKEKISVVFAGGVFDIIHPGHIYTLRSAKALGDLLVVIIARNSTVLKSKGKMPIHDENLRRELVGSLRFVDAAILGREGDIFKTVEFVRPDIIALGYDQVHEEAVIAEECRKRGLNLKVVRLQSPVPDLKSTTIKNTLGESIYNF